MKHTISQEAINMIDEQIRFLKELLTDRIEEYYRSGCDHKDRHALMFYRQELENIRDLLDRNIKTSVK